jgi:hypothetical protein
MLLQFCVLVMAQLSAGSPFDVISEDCSCFGDRDGGSATLQGELSFCAYLVDLYFALNKF